ncbi:MAG TPA: DUF3306 domain-containing protein [Albitalea sp.]
MSADGFLSRWSRRKAGLEVEDTPAPHPDPLHGAASELALPGADVPAPAPVERGAEGEGPAPAPTPAEPQELPPPTMDDVAQLAPGAEVSRFLAPQVDESVKRAALKKLFTDPHFNVMDGLDTYIEDYGRADPIPESMLRRMAQSKVLGLFDHEQREAPELKTSPDGAAPQQVPQSPPTPQEPEAVPPDENPDLRLQQDDAAGRSGAGEGPAA